MREVIDDGPDRELALHMKHGHRLTVVAMAEELHDGLGGDFDLDRSAAALDSRHSFDSGSGRGFR
jgi:hypothetical protein